MTTNLANRLFGHFLITNSKFFPNHIKSNHAACEIIDINLFTYIAIGRYLFDKFYRNVIYTDVLQDFTTGYKQFKTYTSNIFYRTIYIYFGISLILFMGSVFFQIRIGHLTYYIFKADALFLV